MSNENTTQTEVSTKANGAAEPVVTNLTIDWSDMTPDDIRALAQQALIVKLQGGWRKNGIPAGDATVKAADHKVGARAPKKPADIVALFQAMSAEDRAAFLAKYAG